MKRLERLARIAVGVPMVVGIIASFAWEIAKMPSAERDELYAVAWDAFFVGEDDKINRAYAMGRGNL